MRLTSSETGTRVMAKAMTDQICAAPIMSTIPPPQIQLLEVRHNWIESNSKLRYVGLMWSIGILNWVSIMWAVWFEANGPPLQKKHQNPTSQRTPCLRKVLQELRTWTCDFFPFVGSVCRTETIQKLLRFKSKFPNHFVSTLGRYLFLLFLVHFIGSVYRTLCINFYDSRANFLTTFCSHLDVTCPCYFWFGWFNMDDESLHTLGN